MKVEEGGNEKRQRAQHCMLCSHDKLDIRSDPLEITEKRSSWKISFSGSDLPKCILKGTGSPDGLRYC
jgi:hypothetical protein